MQLGLAMENGRHPPVPWSPPRRLRRHVPALVCALLAACGAPSGPPRVEVAPVEQAPSWLSDTHLEERTLGAARTVASHWGGGDLDGWTIRFVGEIGACGAVPAGVTILGCTRPDDRVVDVSVAAESPCVEATSLLHEVGHVVLGGDAGHADPRWSDGRFWASILADVGRAIPQADANCAETIAVWRLWWEGR